MVGRGSRSKERGAVDRGGGGDTHGSCSKLNREIIPGDGIAKFSSSDVGVEVEGLYDRIRSWSGRCGEV